jgi:thiosulfate/3-mercaptopyruvate sulfurtransferase
MAQSASYQELSPLISVHDLVARRPEVVLLDATVELPAPRTDGDYCIVSGRPGWLAGHIPGSRHVDLAFELTDTTAGYHFAHLPPGELAARAGGWGVTAGHRVVAYDQGGTLWAARLWWELRAIGVNVQVLDGGLPAWQAAGLPVESGDPGEPEPGAMAASGVSGAPAEVVTGTVPVGTASAAAAAWADRDDVLDALAGRTGATLVCALGEDVYSGRAATRYTRRGHIPGSRNVPARGLLDGEGLLLPPESLRAAVRPALPDAGSELILYCGGGISAALLALGLTAEGVTGISIYDGSLEEWTADPELPVEVTA